MPKPVRCPACKIILDGGRLVAAANDLANRVELSDPRYAAATYLGEVVRASTDAISSGIEVGTLDPEQIEEAHAWSELQCHRAAFIEDHNQIITPDLLYGWANEDRLRATAMFGGEYDGAWIVDGVKGISRKPSA